MTLANKYLKYSPEITLEIFKLVWDKLIESGFKSRYNNKLYSEFDCFKSKHNYFIIDDICFNTHMSLYIINGLETTVQEILGYDPFVNKEIIPEYVECIGLSESKVLRWSNHYTIGNIYKLNSKPDCNFTYIVGDDNKEWACDFSQFKPSTKEAFDAQNQPKTIEKWSVGSYVVFLKNLMHINTGYIDVIKETLQNDSVYLEKYLALAICRERSGEVKWFATKSEAEEFAKTLVEPVKHGNGILDAVDVKQPLKQAVHCKTQEEWDFVTEKLGYKWSNYSEWSSYKNNTCIGLNKLGFGTADVGYKGYQILSFQEWCDLNGYKMEKEVKFEVGKWYRVTDGESKYIGNYRWYAKSPTLINNIIKTEEYLYENSICKCGNFGKIGTYTFTEVSIEEIQQYLPDGHPDKIKVDREFKIGEYIFVMTKGGCYRDILKVTSVEPDEKDSGIKGTVWIKHENSSFSGGGFRLGSKYRYNEHVRHATPEEINNHLISIEQIPAGEPLNTGIEPNKDGMFKYKQTMPGASWSGGTIDNHLDVMIPTTGNSYNKDFSTSIIPVKSISTAIEFNYLPEPK